MAGKVLHFGPHPIHPRFSPHVPAPALTRIDRLARAIRATHPDLEGTEAFGGGVAPGLADVPTLHIHDVAGSFEGGSPVPREHRALFLARDGDAVVLGTPSHDFVRYCRYDLKLGRVEILTPGPQVRPRRLAFRVLNDPALRRRIERIARVAGGLNLVPYQATEGLWALAGRIAWDTGVPVYFGGPPPGLASLVNNKVRFSEWIGRLLGRGALPPTTSASSWAHLAQRVRQVARTQERVGIKLPSAAGSAGNLVLDSAEILALPSLVEVRAHLFDLFAGLGWTHPFPTLVSVWEDSVLASPSLQGWIPHPDQGLPILEGVFDQSVTGPRGRFVGCAPSALADDVQERIALEGAQILLLFQRLGWYGRCSLDTILVGTDPCRAEVHWVECNGRWGGTSIPMTLVNRLTGSWAHRPFVTAGGLLPDGHQWFHDLRQRARSRLYDDEVGGGLVLLTPGPRETGTGFAVLSVGRSLGEARLGLSHFLGDLHRTDDGPELQRPLDRPTIATAGRRALRGAPRTP